MTSRLPRVAKQFTNWLDAFEVNGLTRPDRRSVVDSRSILSVGVPAPLQLRLPCSPGRRVSAAYHRTESFTPAFRPRNRYVETESRTVAAALDGVYRCGSITARSGFPREYGTGVWRHPAHAVVSGHLRDVKVVSQIRVVPSPGSLGKGGISGESRCYRALPPTDRTQGQRRWRGPGLKKLKCWDDCAAVL